MEFYITQCIAGFIAFDEDLQIADYNLFTEDEVVSNLIKIEENEILDEEIELINGIRLDSIEEDRIIIETTKRKSQYKELENYGNIEVKTPNKGGEYLRSNIDKIFEEIGFSEGQDEIIQIYEKLAIHKIKKSSQEEDKLLIQAINSVDDIDESISKLVERIRDWYTIYFPEMDTISNNETYIKLIAESENREDILENFNEHFAEEIEESTGADIVEDDLLMLKSFSESIYSLQKSRRELETYIDSKMEAIAPNLRDLLGSTLGAKLIAHIGSIKRLATYPASVIQIMGAEKAIFRHLKTGERPPKHGLIFQHPSVRGAKWWNRGKIARNLALKITLAVRKDVFSGEYDPSIAEDYLKKVEQIEKENPFPKKTSQKRAKERKAEKDKGKGKSKKYKGNKKNKKNKKKRRK
ncbi:MAG: ATP-binding protein [Methanobrevibacter ruminantium]|uniref:NOP5/NOP56 family protein n=1 Tax=Methanobrevibacter ruminantium TaxID=83816 RepID=UPI0026F25315|nr:ATP-binding protein [Methanobrevibacter ruminantium]MDD6048613.1 ATP-binding protein [Methanobrevibacter ruminantium]